MKSASILCFTEISLDADNWPGWSKFKDYSLYSKLRKNTSKNSDTDLRKSGGVAILVKNSLNSGFSHGLGKQHLEMTSTVTEWANKISFVSCIYKDHDMPKNVFLNDMDDIFENHGQLSYPSIIAGDFNLYDDKNHYNGLLNSSAEKHGFVPTVHQGTTINDHLLDQIFITESYLSQSKTVVLPSYFSDHDLIVLCLPR